MAETKSPSEVLAFLLGSTPGAQAANNETAAVDRELPDLEPVSDSDKDIKHAVESLVAETDNAEGQTSDCSYQEAEHEDDCSAAVGEQSTDKKQVTVKDPMQKRRPSRSSSPPLKVKEESLKETKEPIAGAAVEDFTFVGGVAAVLVAYLVACVYSFFHPLAVPLPDYEALYTAYDMSNVSVGIVNPVNSSQITPQGVLFEWEVRNFPTEALHRYGAEVFQFRLSLDDEVFASEIGFLAVNEDDQSAALNRTVTTPIPWRRFSRSQDTKRFKLHLEVKIPNPGLIEEFKTFEQSVHVWKPAAPGPKEQLRIDVTSPDDGATFEWGRSIVLEYFAVNVHELEVFVDQIFYAKKTYVDDGNLLLRGLGVGVHIVEVKALSEGGKTTASSRLRVEVVESIG